MLDASQQRLGCPVPTLGRILERLERFRGVLVACSSISSAYRHGKALCWLPSAWVQIYQKNLSSSNGLRLTDGDRPLSQGHISHMLAFTYFNRRIYVPYGLRHRAVATVPRVAPIAARARIECHQQHEVGRGYCRKVGMHLSQPDTRCSARCSTRCHVPQSEHLEDAFASPCRVCGGQTWVYGRELAQPSYKMASALTTRHRRHYPVPRQPQHVVGG